MKPIITRKMLTDRDACQSQVDLFDKHFPSGSVVVTAAKARKFAGVFDISWLDCLLDRESLADYDAKCAAILADYRARRAAIWADYDARRAAILADYRARRAAIWAKCYIDMCKRVAADERAAA